MVCRLFTAARSARSARRRGLSLIELLAVVAIIGVIAALIIPRVSVATSDSRARVRESHISQLNRLIETYRVQTDSFPSTLNDLVTAGYLPDGVPTDPDGGTYSINSGTYRIDYTP